MATFPESEELHSRPGVPQTVTSCERARHSGSILLFFCLFKSGTGLVGGGVGGRSGVDVEVDPN